MDLQGGAGITGTFGLDYSALNLALGLEGSFDTGTGIFSINAIPEPSRAMLLLAGLLGIALRRRRSQGAGGGIRPSSDRCAGGLQTMT